ncbi:MarR family transcriptional regulator [Actinomycetospora endophytica]|uniref:MarR family transcriptional regulator n=1 Tax=Actinomycetospora endophytica TaxID=2291215 RepID=A0ABS8PAI0_9PSEU|nr:MarR family transcriptional regulator [Actinomycetospora endophytica]MCD2195272.1 MarR family transcriptional regulator [Actinomycetospora endophytica]
MADGVRELMVAEESYRRAVAAAMGIAPVEATALEFLLHNGARTPSLIAARTGLSRTSTTALVDRLAAAGWVARRPHPLDRRSVLVDLTDDGFDVVCSTYLLFARDIGAALDEADPRLREDPQWRRAVGSLVEEIAASLRHRAGDVLGVEAALSRHLVGTETALPDAGSGDTGPPSPGRAR